MDSKNEEQSKLMLSSPLNLIQSVVIHSSGTSNEGISLASFIILSVIVQANAANSVASNRLAKKPQSQKKSYSRVKLNLKVIEDFIKFYLIPREKKLISTKEMRVRSRLLRAQTKTRSTYC